MLILKKMINAGRIRSNKEVQLIIEMGVLHSQKRVLSFMKVC